MLKLSKASKMTQIYTIDDDGVIRNYRGAIRGVLDTATGVLEHAEGTTTSVFNAEQAFELIEILDMVIRFPFDIDFDDVPEDVWSSRDSFLAFWKAYPAVMQRSKGR